MRLYSFLATTLITSFFNTFSAAPAAVLAAPVVADLLSSMLAEKIAEKLKSSVSNPGSRLNHCECRIVMDKDSIPTHIAPSIPAAAPTSSVLSTAPQPALPRNGIKTPAAPVPVEKRDLYEMIRGPYGKLQLRKVTK